MPRGIELQFRTRSRLTKTEKGEALTISFKLGPLAVFLIVNLPEYEGDNGETPLCYVKLSLDVSDDWEFFKDHSASMSRHKTPTEG